MDLVIVIAAAGLLAPVLFFEHRRLGQFLLAFSVGRIL
jgi:hypothetical protein